MKRAISNVGATVRNDVLVLENRHGISFATGQLLRLIHSVGSQPTCSSSSAAALPCTVMAGFVPASLPKCGNLATLRSGLLGGHMWAALKSRVSRQSSITVWCARCIVLLKDVNFIGDAYDGWQLTPTSPSTQCGSFRRRVFPLNDQSLAVVVTAKQEQPRENKCNTKPKKNKLAIYW